MNINGFYSSLLAGLLLFTIGCHSGGGKESISSPPAPPPPKQYKFDQTRGCFQEAIVNGTVANSDNPLTSHVVMLISRYFNESTGNTEDTLCTGSLVGPKTILTAAHCFPKNTISTQVVASINLFCSSGFNQKLIYPARLVTIHPQYQHKDNPSSNSPDSDVAVVKFDGLLPAHYSPLALEKIDIRQEMQNTNSHLVMVGYGRTSLKDQSLPELRYLSKNWDRLILFKDSVNLVDTLGLLSVNQSDSRGGCSGDSGGPLLIEDQGNYKIIGVASYIESASQSKLCEQGQIYYSYISTYWDWIEAQTR